MTPGYKDGRVYVSTVPRRRRSVGTLWALDARTGADGGGGRRSRATCGATREVNGGGGMWHPPAFDERGRPLRRDRQPGPVARHARAPRGAQAGPGPNRWNNSLVKLDARSGRFLWGTQVLPHDIYDWDLECPPILATRGGRRVVLTAGKMGFVYAFDADTGGCCGSAPSGSTTATTTTTCARCAATTRRSATAAIFPGDWGGVETQMASDGSTVYVPVNNLYAIYHAQTLPEHAGPDRGAPASSSRSTSRPVA